MQQGLGTMLDTPSADTPRRVHDGRQHWGEHRAYHAGTDAICGKYADAASLLPGLLAATRTGLPPAGDDELTDSKIPLLRHSVTSRSAGRTNLRVNSTTDLPSRPLCGRRWLRPLWSGSDRIRRTIDRKSV